MSNKKQAQKAIAEEIKALLSLIDSDSIPKITALRIIEHYQAIARASSVAGTLSGRELLKLDKGEHKQKGLEFCQVAPSRYNAGECILIF